MSETLEDVLNRHRPTDERAESGHPMCGCGRDLGWHETWHAHVAAAVREHLAGQREAVAEALDPYLAYGVHPAPVVEAVFAVLTERGQA